MAEYFRRVPAVVGERWHFVPCKPHGPYILRPRTELALLAVGFFAVPRYVRVTRSREADKDTKMQLPMVCALMAVAAATPGLLRVPKVYNAVITSNQNLSPSRAFPVIQPVIHRTAVGYVPPFYHIPITAAHLAAPERARYSPVHAGGSAANAAAQRPSASRLVESTSFGVAKERQAAAIDRAEETSSAAAAAAEKQPGKSDDDRLAEPLSFYPNHHSLYYDPYVYTYNTFGPRLVPGSYYVNYRAYDSLQSAPRKADSGGPLASRERDERRDGARGHEGERIPDVPPPPPPTSSPKES